ncbi:MAG: C_GCAxxG_C_C family protein [Synergistales bacterium]|nr:C_GCAxxG_C_C family protein [Synergistales bacterium]
MVTLKLLDEVYQIPLNRQVIEAAHGMNGAGRYGAQCGLIEGMLMFLGIWGKARNLNYQETQELCKEYAGIFEDTFGSLLCSCLKPEAKSSAKDPDHPCEELKIKALLMDMEFLLRKDPLNII